MKRNQFLSGMILFLLSPYIGKSNLFQTVKSKNQVRLLRHATIILQIGTIKILVDPMLSPKNAMDPVQNCGNDTRIPMVDLPVDTNELNKILQEIDAIFITHSHRDHWDTAAQSMIPKSKPIFCQPTDEATIKTLGFENVTAIHDQVNWKDITIHRTSGQHGTGEIGKKMGIVSGFVFDDGKQKTYVLGDSIWCPEVQQALDNHNPDVLIANAGGAQFLTGGPITMIPDHILNLNRRQPKAKVIAVHMDTVNHCLIKRKDLMAVLEKNNLTAKILIPDDGEALSL
jgi:L-ascorbate metabolism protein UlaG (beta-lactamase superfamily)